MEQLKEEPVITRANEFDPHKAYQWISKVFAKANKVELTQTRHDRPQGA